VLEARGRDRSGDSDSSAKGLPLSAYPTITARYLTRFQCLGGSCEDTCCQGWKIQVDRPHYQILKKKMGGSPDERAAFRTAVVPDRSDERTESNFAWIRLDPETGMCPFLSSKKLCSVQGRYGAEALPDLCATYPRIVAQTNERFEVWGSLSCPELVRQCLLRDDAMDIVDAPEELAASRSPGQQMPDCPTPYQYHLDDIRSTAFQLLSDRSYPISTRLFLLAHLGHETAGFFHKNAMSVDSDRLAAAVERVTNPANVAEWHKQLAAMPAPEALTARLVSQLIRERLKVSAGSFRGLVQSILSSYGDANGASIDENGVATMTLPDLWNAYGQRRKSWMAVLAHRIDLYFENYAKNFWLRDWYVTSNDLLSHVHQLLVRVAVLRFLLFGHPGLKELADSDNIGARREALDRAAVEVFYKFSRAIEHDSAFLDLIAARLREQGTLTFEHATLLALL
jgi:lysine-N-methylase